MLFGPDISNYQAGIDVARIRAEGFDFLSAKATQGSGYRSPSYPRQRDAAVKAGLIFYAYHYVDTSDPAAQARNFLGYVGDRKIACMLDWEKGSGDGAWLRKVVAAFRAAGAVVPLVYAPRWYWQQVGSPSLAGLPPLVASSYPSTRSGAASALYENVTESRWADYGGNRVAILQFTDRANVAGQQIDVNAYPGTREQLISLLYGTPVTPAPGASASSPVTEDLVASQTFMQPSINIQVEAECGAGSAVFERAWVVVMIPDGVANVTVYPAWDKGNGQTAYGAKQGAVLNKAAGYRRAVFEMPASNTDCCVQVAGATSPITVSTVHTPKKG